MTTAVSVPQNWANTCKLFTSLTSDTCIRSQLKAHFTVKTDTTRERALTAKSQERSSSCTGGSTEE